MHQRAQKTCQYIIGHHRLSSALTTDTDVPFAMRSTTSSTSSVVVSLPSPLPSLLLAAPPAMAAAKHSESVAAQSAIESIARFRSAVENSVV